MKTPLCRLNLYLSAKWLLVGTLKLFNAISHLRVGERKRPSSMHLVARSRYLLLLPRLLNMRRHRTSWGRRCYGQRGRFFDDDRARASLARRGLPELCGGYWGRICMAPSTNQQVGTMLLLSRHKGETRELSTLKATQEDDDHPLRLARKGGGRVKTLGKFDTGLILQKCALISPKVFFRNEAHTIFYRKLSCTV